MSHRFCLAIALLALSAAPAGAGVVYSSGHADIGVAFEGGQLHLHAHLGIGAVVDGSPLASDLEVDPGDLTIHADENSKVITDSAIPFLGTSAGDAIWLLPIVNTPGIPFVGIASEELVGQGWSNITWTLTAMTGPGAFALWQFDRFGNIQVRWTTHNGITAADSFSLPSGGHDHASYGFTQEGDYFLTVRASGVLAGTTYSDEGTFHFHVGPITAAAVPEPSTLATAGLGLVGAIGFGLRRKRMIAK